MERMGLAALLEKRVPTGDKRCRVPHAQALGVLVRSIVVEREPIYPGRRCELSPAVPISSTSPTLSCAVTTT